MLHLILNRVKRAAQRESKSERAAIWSQRGVVLTSRIFLLLGALNIYQATQHRYLREVVLLKDILPNPGAGLATSATILSSAAIITFSFALGRRSHAAYLTTQLALLVGIYLGFSGSTHTIRWTSILMFAFLFLIRKEFYAKPQRTRIRQALILFSQFLLMTVIIGITLILLPDHLFGADPTITTVAQTLVNGLVGIRGPLSFVSHREQFIFTHVMVGMALLAIALPILSLLRPNPPKSVMSQNEENELRALLKTYADDSIGYFAFRRDKSAIWSTTRKAAIAYRVVGSCAIASGDPIGNPDAWPLVIHDFLLLCKKNGWTPAAAGVSELGGEIWVRESEMAALEIGDEAVVIVKDYEIESPRYRNMRQTVRKIQKLNYRTEIFRSADLTPELRHLLEVDAMKWRKVDTERGFMMGLGRIAEPTEPDLLLVTAYKGDELKGVLQFVPWGEKNLSLDLMRRSPSSDSGINELMIDALITYCRENGIEKFSLNFAAFRAVFERGAQLGAGPIIKSWRNILLFFSRWIQMESLFRFNSKFRPEWLPRYLIFRKNADLPKIGLALFRAEAFIGGRKEG